MASTSPAPGIRIDQLGEAVRIIKRLWTGERSTTRGATTAWGRPLPAAARAVAAAARRHRRRGREKMLACRRGGRHLELLGGQLRPARPEDRRPEGHCGAIGRDFGTLKLSLQDLVVLAPTDAALEAPLADARRRLSFFGDVDAIATIGTPDRCIDTLRKIAQGITYFVCLFTDGGQPETVRLFGERVLPAFR